MLRSKSIQHNTSGLNLDFQIQSSNNYMGLTTVRSFNVQFDYVFLKTNIQNVFFITKKIEGTLVQIFKYIKRPL